MRNRWWKFILLACAALFLVLGCQNFAAHLSAVDHHNPDVVTLKMSGWGSSATEKQLLQGILRDFEVSHPRINVQFEEIADQYMDVIKTRLIGDAAPDVFYLEAFEAPFLMAQGVLEPLDPYVTPDFEVSDFEPTLLDPFRYNDRIYGLPKDCSTLALFYNKQALAQAGIDRPPTTWAELRRISQALTIDQNQDGRPEQYGFGMLPELARWAYMIRSFGGEVVDQQGYARFAESGGLQGLEMLIDQYRGDRTAAQPSDVGASNTSEMFGQGRAAMVIEGNWAIPYLTETFPDLDFATVEVPRMNDRPGTMVYSVAYVMNQKTQHKAAAWELISYLTGKAGMEAWTSTGFALPSRRSVADVLAFDRDPLRSALIAGIDYATPWQIGQYPSAVMYSFNNQFVSALLGQQPLRSALERAQATANGQIQAAQ